MRTIFVKTRKGLLVVGVVFLAVFIIALIVIAQKTGKMPLWVFGAFIFLLLLVGIGIIASYSSTKKVEKFISNVNIYEDKLTFSKPLKVEEGYFKATGEWHSSGRSRSYHVSREFISHREMETAEITLEVKPFFLAIAQDGSGKIYLSGVRVLDEEFKDIVILYALPSYRLEFPQETLSVSTQEDFAELRISPIENGFRGYLQANLSKARKAKVELIAKGKVEVKEKITETRDVANFEYRFFNEPILVISHYNLLDPQNLLRNLKLGRVIAGHGIFVLRLALDLPFKRDVKEELKFEVKMEEKEDF
jgi:hypothetical protein